MSACIECLRYIFCIKVNYGDRLRVGSEDSLSDPGEPSEINVTKDSVYKKISTWSAYIGRDQLDARDKKIRDLDKYLNTVESSDEFAAV